jgi:phosphotransferase system enzyme I (PtsI)
MSNSLFQELKFRGIPASAGVAIGNAVIVHSRTSSYEDMKEKTIEPAMAEAEVERFKHVLDTTRQEIIAMQRQIRNKFGSREIDIFDAHLLIVDDQMLKNEVVERIRNEHLNAETAYKRTIKRYIDALLVMPDSYIKERADDIKDVASRIINHLSTSDKPAFLYSAEPHIIIAMDLTPSETAMFNRETILGMAVVTGSTISHSAILARSMQLPALVGLPLEAYEAIRRAGEPQVIIDGATGDIIINPAPETMTRYRERIEQNHDFEIRLSAEKNLPVETLDGHRIKLMANLGSADEIDGITHSGAAGVGLFRTEYMFMNRDTLPTEEEQYHTYSELTRRMPDAPLVVRTLDIGGDKLASHIDAMVEANPFLGLRAIRLCLKARKDIFRTQMRAVLRASAHGDIRVMYPMISCTEEVREIQELVKELMRELTAEGHAFNRNIKTGIMIEVPAAALLAYTLAPMVDFFSLGTNDLIQYTMAIDRTNDRVSYLYQPTHPAVLELIQRTIAAGRDHRIETAICGEIAGNPLYTPLLVGMGIEELSMSPGSIGVIRRVIRKLNKREAEVAVSKALRGSTAEDALEISLKMLRQAAPDIAELVMPVH